MCLRKRRYRQTGREVSFSPSIRKGETETLIIIALMSIVGKVFVAVLTKRLQEWCEERRVLVEEQGGFRKKRSTVDQIFILEEMLNMRGKKKKA